jgi:hypothetical protein
MFTSWRTLRTAVKEVGLIIASGRSGKVEKWKSGKVEKWKLLSAQVEK